MAKRTYIAVTDYDAATRNWSIVFPAFECVTSVAQSAAEIPQQAADALATAVEAMEEDGETLPPSLEDGATGDWDRSEYTEPVLYAIPVETRGKAVRVNVSIEEGLLARLDSYGERRGLSRSAAIAQAVRTAIASDA